MPPPGDVGAYPFLENKYPYVWYHSRFAWTATEQIAVLHGLRTGRSPDHRCVLVPGRDGTVIVRRADGRFEERVVVMAPVEEGNSYFRRLLVPIVVRMCQALIRGWLVRHQRRE